MKTVKFISLAFAFLFSIVQFSSAQKGPGSAGTKINVVTTSGNVIVKLYDETPLHKANFLKLINEKYYDGILFHRVIRDFMIQAGDPDSKDAKPGQVYGNGGPNYTVNAEFKAKFVHKKGALAAARTGDDVNPEKKSSGSQFYIVLGKIYTKDELNKLEKGMNLTQILPFIREYIQMPENASILQDITAKQQANDMAGLDSLTNSLTSIIRSKHPELKEIKFSEEQRRIYETVGGTPFLDMNYTVFGEVVEGLNVIEKIGAAETGSNDRPKADIKIISMEILK